LSQGTLAAIHRLAQSIHLVRLDAQDERPREPVPALAPLARDLDSVLMGVRIELQGDRRQSAPVIPDLRTTYSEFEHGSRRDARDDGERAALLAELDEIVDAANGLVTLVGLDPVDPPGERAAGPSGGPPAEPPADPPGDPPAEPPVARPRPR
jgi:hypothetical protein